MQPIETDRLLIRPFVPDDAVAVCAYMADPLVTAWLPEGQLDEAQTRAFISENLGDDAHNHAAILQSTGALIGHMVFHPWFAPHTYEVGWVFHRAHQGKGYATEAARALLRHAFEGMRLHRVIATCQPQNPASWRVMEKLGMRREGHFLRCIHRGGDDWWDEYFYAILAEEWSPLK
jgi:[ribosomal protein S5]-alanine N-acetyltransferase